MQKLNKETQDKLILTLKSRFEKNKKRHKDIAWEHVAEKLSAQPKKIWSLQQMEETGGEPELVYYDTKTDEYIFMDCAAESPKGRRSFCYDQAALEARKEFKPKHSAVGLAEEMGIELLDEEQYRMLQEIKPVDAKTSSWLKTPDSIRKEGGAIFGDYRFSHVFVYHNGVQSYYAARGFRGLLRV